MKLNFFSVISLNKINLDYTSVERVKLVQDYVNIGVREIESGFSSNHRHEEINNSLTSAELEQNPRLAFGCYSVTWLHQILNI